MTVRILAASSPGEIRIAVVAADVLLDYAIWRPGARDGVGDTFLGRVTTKVPAMAGAFVALDGTVGFLPDSEGAAEVTEGAILPVRVTRAPQGGKGPRLSARLAADEAVPGPGKGPLLELAERHPEAPVMVDDAALAARLRPLLRDRLTLARQSFCDAVEEQVQALAEATVELRNGSRIHVHPTPALVAIDCDVGGMAGASAGKSAMHGTANRILVPELARQIRLRNLSGAILVDFAGLAPRRRAALAPALHAALADDPLAPRLLGFTALGLAEIVRPRVHPPLHELLAGPHAAGLAALRAVVAEVDARPHVAPTLRASPAIAAALHADPEALPDLARRTGRSLIIRSDPELAATAWTLESSEN